MICYNKNEIDTVTTRNLIHKFFKIRNHYETQVMKEIKLNKIRKWYVIQMIIFCFR